jgi:hypothetical protein
MFFCITLELSSTAPFEVARPDGPWQPPLPENVGKPPNTTKFPSQMKVPQIDENLAVGRNGNRKQSNFNRLDYTAPISNARRSASRGK